MGSESLTTVKVTNVSKSFGKRCVLDNISLEVKRGEIFGLIGPSGAGKTTLVKMIAGIAKTTYGDITVLNNKMPQLSVLEKNRLYGSI